MQHWEYVVGAVGVLCFLAWLAYMAYGKRLELLSSMHEIGLETAKDMLETRATPETITATGEAVKNITEVTMNVPAFKPPTLGVNLAGVLEVALDHKNAKDQAKPSDLEPKALPAGGGTAQERGLPASPRSGDAPP